MSSVKRSSVSGSNSREEDQLIVTPLGGGNEVGRSCVYMYKGKTVLFDCGIHLAYSGMAALPYFDEIDPSTVDVLLITHFHLDHAASLPYFPKKTTFEGRVFMTYATKAIYKLLLSDFVKVSKVSIEDMLYDEQDINRSMDKIEGMCLVLLCLWLILQVLGCCIPETIRARKTDIFVLPRPRSSPLMSALLNLPMVYSTISFGTPEKNALLMLSTPPFLKGVVC